MPETWRPELMPRYAPFSGAIPAPGVAFDSAPYHCLRISEAWVAIVIGAINALTYECDYVADEELQAFSASEARRLILAIAHGNLVCVEDTMYLLRQNPLNPCQLQQSVDNGLSWSLAFDFAACFARQGGMSSPEAFQVIASANANASALLNVYLDDPTNIFEDGVFDQSPDDEFRNAAMCYAVNVLIAQLSIMIEDRIENGTDWWDIVKKVARASEYVGTLILESIGVSGEDANIYWLFAALTATAVAHWIADYAESQGQEPDLSAILDSDLQQCLTCSAMAVLQGSTPSIGLFSTMFSGASCENMNAGLIALLEAVTESEEVYLQFLEIVQKSFDAISAGQQFNCGCGEASILWLPANDPAIDNVTVRSLSEWAVTANRAGCGLEDPDLGWLAGNEVTTEFTKHRGVEVNIQGLSGTISRMRITFDMGFGTYIDGGNAAYLHYGGDFRAFNVLEVGQGNDRAIERIATRVVNGEYVTVSLFCYVHGTSNPQYNGDCKVRSIEVFGDNLVLA